jgi:predicted nucleotidyltransferase component of viral defense system
LVKLAENSNCYFYPVQKEVLIDLFKNETIRKNFFLTGGTALSVFYLHHRKSNDLDLFTIKAPQFSDIDYWVRNCWQREYVRFKMEPYILSVELKGVKVDFVHDFVSLDDEKVVHEIDGQTVLIDTISNIVSNKLCTLGSRQEPKDFVDFYFLNRKIEDWDFESIYSNAQKKEGMFDDPPMVANQIEYNLEGIKQNPYAFPEMIIEIDMDDFYAFYENLVQRIYHHKI